jgi:hypothetical protein
MAPMDPGDAITLADDAAYDLAIRKHPLQKTGKKWRLVFRLRC